MLVLGMTSAFAATITVTPPANIDANAQNTYTYYKIFDGIAATTGNAISYKLPTGINTPPTGFSVDTAGNVSLTRTTGDLTKLTDAEIAGIKAYVEANASTLVHDSKTVTGSAAAEFTGLDVGYYYIDTTVGTLVVVDTAKTSVEVDDKNTVPSLTKEITAASGSITDKNGNIIDPATADDLGKNAIGQIGTYVNFESKITVGKGMKSYVFHDKMDSGLALDTTEGQITVTCSATPSGYAGATIKTGDQAATGDTLTIEFADGLAEGIVITINYRAKITNEALTITPEKNTAKVEYSNGPRHGFTPEEQTKTYSAKIGVLKLDGSNSDAPLPGAGFKLYKFDTDGTTKLYYSYDASTKTVTWAATTTDERITKSDGTIDAFLGLNDGTYYLEESTVPNGYNAPLSDTTVTITGNDYTASNLEQERSNTIRNNQGTQLPSTGGIGTTLFYVGGGILVLLAVVLLVTKKRMGAND